MYNNTPICDATEAWQYNMHAMVQGDALLVFCWPWDLPDEPAKKLAHVISDLLFTVLGPVTGWLVPREAQPPQVWQLP